MFREIGHDTSRSFDDPFRIPCNVTKKRKRRKSFSLARRYPPIKKKKRKKKNGTNNKVIGKRDVRSSLQLVSRIRDRLNLNLLFIRNQNTIPRSLPMDVVLILLSYRVNKRLPRTSRESFDRHKVQTFDLSRNDRFVLSSREYSRLRTDRRRPPRR